MRMASILFFSSSYAPFVSGSWGQRPQTSLFVLRAGESQLSIQTICWPTLKGSDRNSSLAFLLPLGYNKSNQCRMLYLLGVKRQGKERKRKTRCRGDQPAGITGLA